MASPISHRQPPANPRDADRTRRGSDAPAETQAREASENTKDAQAERAPAREMDVIRVADRQPPKAAAKTKGKDESSASPQGDEDAAAAAEAEHVGDMIRRFSVDAGKAHGNLDIRRAVDLIAGT